MKKRTKIIILTAMVLLLGVTGYLNIVLNKSIKQPEVEQTSTSYFTAYRTDREATRDQEMLYYDAIIGNETSTAEAKASAESARLALVAQMEKELVIEGLIKAKGFEDAIVTISDANVNAIVKSSELKSTEVAQIVSVIQTQLGTDLENIKVFPIAWLGRHQF